MDQILKTLIVEDSDLQAGYLEEILKEFGITDITKAVNGVEGLEIYERELQTGSPFSLVFIDIVMPVMDGQELLKRIRTLEDASGTGSRSITIMTTALNTPDDMLEALIYGDCNDYIVKPVDDYAVRALLTKYALIE